MLLPRTIGATIDEIAKLDTKTEALSAKINELKDQRDILLKHLANNFAKGELDGAKGKLGTATVVRQTVPEVTDWEAFYKYISRTKGWDLLQRRPGARAIAARWAENKVVPGVQQRELETIKVSAIKRK